MRDLEATTVEQRDFLLTGVAWQDTLLQSYRGLHVAIQGFLLATSSAVVAVQLTGAAQEQAARPLAVFVFNLLITGLLGVLFWLQDKTSAEMREVVVSRAKALDYWQKETMIVENGLNPPQRTFTSFKVLQRSNYGDTRDNAKKYLGEDGLTQSGADELMGQGFRHTRSVLDVNLFVRLRALCLAIVLTSCGVSAWFGWLWWRAAP